MARVLTTSPSSTRSRSAQHDIEIRLYCTGHDAAHIARVVVQDANGDELESAEGRSDGITRFTRPVSGSFAFAPSVRVIAEIG
jgi:hypothetical protein